MSAQQGRSEVFEGAPFMGVYVDQGGKVSAKEGRGVYYLYYCESKGQWIVGVDPNSGEGWLFVEDRAEDPTRVKGVWKYWDTDSGSWKSDGGVTVSLARAAPPRPRVARAEPETKRRRLGGDSAIRSINPTSSTTPKANPYMRGTKGLGSGLVDVDWSRVQLVPFPKKFYMEKPSVSRMAPAKVTAFRASQDISVVGKDAPRPVRSFEEASFAPYMLKELARAGFERPTAIQSQAWPAVMSGRDIVGIADTGSGKTLAYILPCIVHVNAQPLLGPREGPIALVLAPTRELAAQIHAECERFGRSSRLRFATVFGGVPKGPQVACLRRGAEVVVATPGRLLDLLARRVTNLQRVTFLVLDEADRMLDMGFERFVRRICAQVRPDRQTLCFSATWPDSVAALSRRYSHEALHIRIGSEAKHANRDVQQKVILLEQAEKQARLEAVLTRSMIGGKILVFCARKRTCEWVTERLRTRGWPARCLHGDKAQREREWVLGEFRSGESPIMVATNIAARGLHVKGVTAVVNYDFPNNIETYIHRVGRTGRAGARGVAWTFFTPEDAMHAKDLSQVLVEAGQTMPEALAAYAAAAKT